MSMSDYANHDDDMRGGTGSVWRCAPAVSYEIPSCGPIVDMHQYNHPDEWNLSRAELVRLLNDERGAAEVVDEHSRQELDAERVGRAADLEAITEKVTQLVAQLVAHVEAQVVALANAVSEQLSTAVSCIPRVDTQGPVVLGDYDRESFKASERTGRLPAETTTGASPSPAATDAPLPNGADRLVAIGWKVEWDGDELKVTDPTESEMYLSRSEIGRGTVTWLAIGASRQSMVKP